MTFTTLIHGLRIVNALLAGFVVLVLVARGTRFFSEYDKARKWGYTGFVLYAFATAEFSTEAYVEKIPLGGWSFFFLLANLATIYAMIQYKLFFGNLINSSEEDERSQITGRIVGGESEDEVE